MESEVGRELKVSELKPRTVVIVHKEGRPHAVTVWVVEVGESFVHFSAGEIRMEFLARRTGPEQEQITDEDGLPMHIYEYLGEV